MSKVTVVGAGLAGSEAAWQLAQRGLQVELVEMKPHKMSPAHTARISVSWFAPIPCVATGWRTQWDF